MSSSCLQDYKTEEQTRASQQLNTQAGKKAKRTLVLSDVHHKWKKAQVIIDSVPHDHVIHLGDHQDDFGDTPWQALATAKWTKDRLDAGDTILLGNHDLPYWFPHPKHNWGCGWDSGKHNIIQSVLSTKDRKKFKLWVECEGWLLSHAGFCSMYADLVPYHDIFIDETLHSGDTHPLIYSVGAARSGMFSKLQSNGGCLWIDWNELKCELDKVGVVWKQIVGHTPHKYPNGKKRQDGNTDWCIDTHLKHYGIIEDGEFTTHEVPKVQ